MEESMGSDSIDFDLEFRYFEPDALFQPFYPPSAGTLVYYWKKYCALLAIGYK